ncbi:MAG: hypothetical protein JOZ18_08680 [Chloroflexi bacterium]|nr:hypothetical protein [Chloroflexota bacterium]
MSMSEFERRQDGSEDDLALLSMQDRELPKDFSDEDMAFAQELEALFAIDEEEIPPYFVQTLLDSEEPRFQPVEHGFEKKVSARVFRRLKLRRRIFRAAPSPIQTIVDILPPRRPLLTLVATCMLVLFLTVLATGNSFASGLGILLSGPHSGVLQLYRYPDGVAPTPRARPTPDASIAQPRQLSLLEAQEQLHFSMYWPQANAMPPNYVLNNIYLYNGADQIWADGPVMELDYDYTYPGVTPHDTGRIAICEFKPMGNVLQGVQLGAFQQIQIGPNGDAALYVNGQWKKINQSTVWVYDGRSELIYERDGVIFWIVGNQLDGVDGNVLRKIASSLSVLDVSYALHLERIRDLVTQSGDESSMLFAGDIIYLDNPDGPDGPTLRLIGTNSPDANSGSTQLTSGGNNSP